MSIKITSLELENVKRVRAVRLEPSVNGLTVIGGDNAQGKTSILDAICFALGGERYRPTNLQREGGAAEARIELTLSNGLKVERKGKNASLKVSDPAGTKGGQALLDAFVEKLALDLPKFLAMSGKEKAGVLLRILGIDEQLAALDKEEKALYDERHAQGRIADQKEKYAAEMPEYHDAPDDIVSPAELVRQSQEIMRRNAERENARRHLEQITERYERAQSRVAELMRQLDDARRSEAEAKAEFDQAAAVEITVAESTAEIEARMADIESINAQVRANLNKRKAIEDASHCRTVYDQLTEKIESVRSRRMALLDGAAMPLDGLGIANGELTYNGKAWDCMSGAEQATAGIAIVRELRPECGFVLLDGLERFDATQVSALGAWLDRLGLQGIATRVSRGDECSIIIEDGLVVGAPISAEPQAAEIDW
jgi:DNA repair exonuclease SbcCD ATPase subunit